MPKLKSSLPKYRLHRASGQAVVTLYGKDIYLGPWRSKASKLEYDRLIREWVAGGRPTRQVAGTNDITVVELAAAYLDFAKGYYRKNGKSTDTIYQVQQAAAIVCEQYGRTNASDFGPLALKAIQAELIERDLSRTTINHLTATIRRMFRWGVAEELIAPAVLQALAALPGLKKGRTQARETPPVRPVADEIVDATLPFLQDIAGDMVRFQRLTGCRPAEVCMLRPCDLDRSGDVWLYRPESHKTEHHDRDRVICIGPKAQDLLRKYLLREADAYCFSPQDSERKRRASLHSQRKTPLNCGNVPGSNRKRTPTRQPGACYTTDSYRRAVTRGCRLANKQRQKEGRDDLLPEWHPNQLRHSAATSIRRQFGLEAAQVTLGHAAADVTQIYAEKNLTLAVEVMRRIG